MKLFEGIGVFVVAMILAIVITAGLLAIADILFRWL